MRALDLRTPLSLRTSLLFPLQSRASRHEVLAGATWLLVPFLGWLWNMGHRIEFVHRMLRNEPAWPATRQPLRLLGNGALTFVGMALYLAPGSALVFAGVSSGSGWMSGIGLLLQAIAIIAIPGFMSHYCVAFDPREIFDPRRSLRRVVEGGAAYWHAWGIALVALALSFLVPVLVCWPFIAAFVLAWKLIPPGPHAYAQVLSFMAALAALVVSFGLTSVWFWQVAGFSFATVFSRRFALHAATSTRSAGDPSKGPVDAST